MGLDPDGMSDVELYDLGWNLVVKSIPDTPEGKEALGRLLEQFDLDETEKKKSSLNRDLAVLGIGNIENLKKLAAAQGKKLIIPAYEDGKKDVVR